MKNKRNPLEKFLDRTIVLSFKQLIILFLLSLGFGALIAIISFDIGIILIVPMLFLVLYKIVFFIITLMERIQ